ncbi:hypothetical protein [Vibrio renipiscarius]|uniref:Uncharacterized protein n=1 Tax=Vibrio renipiscarius TaxID=1461322 RepID=A0A0C2NDH6_9VIBR|nr:hypothetical protein [Vibrio renipiscarius]KII75249.1 hypothetical protein OJ16_19515 [Vibrio renipiscarius]KII77641.1 hypothetical protein PL18_15460 [Vibrio renipiscarius]
MRWVVLLFTLSGIIGTANWGYHYVDNAVLITDLWKADSTPNEWGLVDFKVQPPTIYEYTGTKGFWNIFKGLWPIWTLFTVSFIFLIPLSMYIYNGRNNAQILKAIAEQNSADERAKKAESDAKNAEIRMRSWAEEKVRTAYQEQLSHVKKELENEWDEYHRIKNNIVERESAIQRREQTALEKEEWAKQTVIEIQEKYRQEKMQFDQTLQENRTAKKNAQSGQLRLKKEKQLITNFLNNEGWTIENTPLTYEKLRALAKGKQR